MNWTGILIAADPITFRKLTTTNHKSWPVSVCASLHSGMRIRNIFVCSNRNSRFPHLFFFKIDEALGHLEEIRCRIFGSDNQCAVFPVAHDSAGRRPNGDRFVQSGRGRARIKSAENHFLAQSGYQSKILGAAALIKHNDYRSVLIL